MTTVDVVCTTIGDGSFLKFYAAALAGAEAIRQARGVNTFLYRPLYRAHQARYGKPFIVGSQGIGDCVSWGWAHGIWISQSVDWELGRLPEPPLAPATESLYGGSRVEARNKPEGGGGWSGCTNVLSPLRRRRFPSATPVAPAPAR